MTIDQTRVTIPKDTVFDFIWLGQGPVDRLKALEDIEILRIGEVAPRQYKVEIISSSVGATGEKLDIAIWEHEYQLLSSV